jgi:hypothetical protein
MKDQTQELESNLLMFIINLFLKEENNRDLIINRCNRKNERDNRKKNKNESISRKRKINPNSLRKLW